MIRSKTKFRRGKIAVFAWMAAALCGFALYWGFMTNLGVRDFWDPPYVTKAELLKARLKEYPGHPLWLIMGTSRVDEGLRPGLLADTLRSGSAPLVFNFGIGGADLFRQWVQFRRLLADGIKPRRAVFEIPCVLMDRRTEMFADDPRLLVRARRDELDELCSYGADPAATRRAWIESRLNPFYKDGMRVPNQTLSLRLIPLPGLGKWESRPYDAWGWFAGPLEAPPPGEYARRLESAHGEYAQDFKKDFAVSPAFDKVLRGMIDLCRKSGIDIVLLRMPEDRDFQAFYPAEMNAAIASYLAGIEAEYKAPLIDARSWFPGKENFIDGHHLTGNGAELFTRRFVDTLSNL